MLPAHHFPQLKYISNLYQTTAHVHWHNSRLLHLDCNVVVRQNSRGTRETEWMPYYSVWSGSGSREGEGHVSVTEAETDESSVQSSRKSRHMTQLITAHHPGRDRIQAAPSPSCLFKHLHTVLFQLKATHKHIFIYTREISEGMSRQDKVTDDPVESFCLYVIGSF